MEIGVAYYSWVERQIRLGGDRLDSVRPKLKRFTQPNLLTLVCYHTR